MQLRPAKAFLGAYKMPRNALFVIYTICILSLTTIAEPNYFVSIDCPDTNNTYAPNSTYKTNLDTLFSILSSKSNNTSNGFFKSMAGGSPPNVAYGLFLCRGDITPSMCQECVTKATAYVVERCPRSKQGTIWFEECMLRYSNVSIFSVLGSGGGIVWSKKKNVTDATRLQEVLGEVMQDIICRASSDHSGRKFAVAKASYSPLKQVYGLGQCTPDLSDSQCSTCLQSCISKFPTCCKAKRGASILFYSCNVRYEMHRFYNASFGAPPIDSSTTTTSSLGNGVVPSKKIIATAVPTGLAIMLCIAGIYRLRKRAKKKNDSINDCNVQDMSEVQSLHFDLGTIQTATDNFSNDNKIGEGGFGLVYKGILPDGQEVAVKRLSRTSRQGAVEFKNEVVLVAKLQHRNLVRLLGFCLEGEEKILIYQFVRNKSLDCFLFDPQEREKLDWSRRYKIIDGVARGMLYLHEGSQLTIIHRDLKVDNILLDDDMNAKISDFGTARIFGVDQSQGSTSRIIGTLGYMSPEYAMYGEFSIKSDVFSFGVSILEIISGKKNTNFYQSDSAMDLPSYAWKLWREGRPLDLMDPTIKGSHFRIEVTRCIHIALLGVQDDPDLRPSMATVVLMLNSYSTSLVIPQEPGFLGWSEPVPNIHEELESDPRKSIQRSLDEASISEPEPR